MVTKEKIVSHFSLGYFHPLGIPIGWRFYPIFHQNKAYVVEFKIEPKILNYGRPTYDVWGTIYKYKEKKTFLGGHKGEHVFSKQINRINLKDGRILQVKDTTEEEFMCTYPQIIEGLFELFCQRDRSKRTAQQIIQDNNNWDGVIS